MPTAVSVSIYVPIFLPHDLLANIVTSCLGSFLACVNNLSCTYQQPSQGINPGGGHKLNKGIGSNHVICKGDIPSQQM